jgi:hypothetical protein
MARSEEAQHAYNMRRRVQRCIDKVDRRLALLQGDGEFFEGPVLEVWYCRTEERSGVSYLRHDESIPEQEQRVRLTALFQLLEGRGIPVKYADQRTGAHFPCLEIALDPEFHVRMMATIAKTAYERGAEQAEAIVRRLGIHL